jgi:hypothetical protein
MRPCTNRFAAKKENEMPFPLTPQEKKVLGFVLFLLVFGLVVLGVKHLIGSPNAGGFQSAGTPDNARQTR